MVLRFTCFDVWWYLMRLDDTCIRRKTCTVSWTHQQTHFHHKDNTSSQHPAEEHSSIGNAHTWLQHSLKSSEQNLDLGDLGDQTTSIANAPTCSDISGIRVTHNVSSQLQSTTSVTTWHKTPLTIRKMPKTNGKMEMKTTKTNQPHMSHSQNTPALALSRQMYFPVSYAAFALKSLKFWIDCR